MRWKGLETRETRVWGNLYFGLFLGLLLFKEDKKVDSGLHFLLEETCETRF